MPFSPLVSTLLENLGKMKLEIDLPSVVQVRVSSPDPVSLLFVQEEIQIATQLQEPPGI
jgi:hypothetical protein